MTYVMAKGPWHYISGPDAIHWSSRKVGGIAISLASSKVYLMSEVLETSERSPGIVITGTAIAAFAASNLYVFGLALALHQSLATQ
jgi:hypothetical protein